MLFECLFVGKFSSSYYQWVFFSLLFSSFWLVGQFMFNSFESWNDCALFGCSYGVNFHIETIENTVSLVFWHLCEKIRRKNHITMKYGIEMTTSIVLLLFYRFFFLIAISAHEKKKQCKRFALNSPYLTINFDSVGKQCHQTRRLNQDKLISIDEIRSNRFSSKPSWSFDFYFKALEYHIATVLQYLY